MTDSPKPSPTAPNATPPDASALILRHLRIGWWSMLVFVTLGIGLEALHAFKSMTYLGVGNETRRLMWTLTHAHGIGLSLLHLGFVATVRGLAPDVPARLAQVSVLLTWGGILLPLGFLLGGITTHAGDPGIGVWLVPVGALCIWLAVAGAALATRPG